MPAPQSLPTRCQGQPRGSFSANTEYTANLFRAYGFTAIPPSETTLRHTIYRSTCHSPSALTCGDFQCIYIEARGGILNTCPATCCPLATVRHRRRFPVVRAEPDPDASLRQHRVLPRRPGAQTTPGLQLQTWRCNGTLAQQFWVAQ